MSQKIYIGQISKGLEQYYLPFNIDNDSFPNLYNAYTWRGRVKRKRGTIPLGRLRRQLQIAAVPNAWQLASFNLTGGAGNLINQYSLGSSASVVPTTISLTISGQTYTDPNSDGLLQGSGGGTGTINYTTGAFTIAAGGASAVIGTFSYYPGLPVMGLRNFITTSSQYPLLLAFDTTYSYQIKSDSTFFYNTSFYKTSNTTYVPNPVIWSGQNYQQFWTTNYQGALWATNGKSGFHYVNGTYTAGSGTTMVTFNFKSGGVNFTNLKIGDQLWFNEWNTGGSNINGLVGTVTNIAGAATGDYVVTFANVQVVAGTGIAQLLTNSISGQDGIKWYDGDPTSDGYPPTTNPPNSTGFGWVNFSPPLTASTTIIDDEPAKLYYLVGATAVLPFKDRLLFFSPYIQAADGSSAVQLNDVALWSWNGTPYYTSLVPTGQTSDSTAYYVDRTDKGGWISAGIDQSIVTINNNEDVLLVGFTNKQTRFVFTGNDLYPFLFYLINSELGSASTFSGITLDRGALSFGLNGLVLTSQIGAQRIDLPIPNQVFQLKGPDTVFAAQRISSERDFYHEWVYFTFVPNTSQWSFPTQTLQYNYREESWALLYENFTAHGTYRRQSTYTWQTIPFATWNTWNETWASSSLSALFPSVIAGNPQGFVLIKGQGSGEAPSGQIKNISNNSALVQINSIDHCVAAGDYLYFQNILNGVILNTQVGMVDIIIDANNFTVDLDYVNSYSITNATQATSCVLTIDYPTDSFPFSVGQQVTISGVSGMTQLNGNTYQITAVSATTVTLNVNSTGFGAYISGGTATLIGYEGLGTFTRLSQPFIQTKQFPVYWKDGRQIRLGPQKYLLDYTDEGQVTLYIYLSQDPDTPYNKGPIVPDDETTNNSLVYSTILFTSPESNNLQTPIASNQYQIWHRINTSLIGETFQVGITLNDEQMRSFTLATSEIGLHAMQFDVFPGPLLA